MSATACKPRGFFWKTMSTCARTVVFAFLLSITPAFAADVDQRLWLAASHGDLEGAKAAIEDGADVDHVPLDTSTLQVAAMNGHADVVGLLLKRGANINIVDKSGDTPLITALRAFKKTVIEVLIADGADVRRAGSYGYSPLHLAAIKGDPDIVKLLLARGGNPNAIDKSGETPLDMAGSGSVADILLANGGHVSAVSADGTPLRGVDRDLLMAAVVGSAEGVRSAVGRGAHVNIRIGSRAETPLIRAVYLGRADAATALLNAGADVEETNSNHQTPLHIAVGQGNLKLVQLLLSHRANIDDRDYLDQTPLRADSGHVEA